MDRCRGISLHDPRSGPAPTAKIPKSRWKIQNPSKQASVRQKMLIFCSLGIVSNGGSIWRGPGMVWEACFEENGFFDLDRCRDTPLPQKWVGAGTLQCRDGFLNPFLMGMGSPGAYWCWDSPGYCPLLGPIRNILLCPLSRQLEM